MVVTGVQATGSAQGSSPGTSLTRLVRARPGAGDPAVRGAGRQKYLNGFTSPSSPFELHVATKVMVCKSFNGQMSENQGDSKLSAGINVPTASVCSACLPVALPTELGLQVLG